MSTPFCVCGFNGAIAFQRWKVQEQAQGKSGA